MNALIIRLLCTMVLLSSCDQMTESNGPDRTDVTVQDGPAEAQPDESPLGKLNSDVTPIAYRLDLVIDPDLESFEGVVEIDVTTARDLSRIWLHGDGLEMESVLAVTDDGTQIAATYEQVDMSGVARLDFDAALPKGRATLRATYTAPFQSAPDGLYRAEEGDAFYAASQFQATSARKVFPSFDEPRFKTPFDISITTKTGDIAITATPESSNNVLDDGRTRHVFRTTARLPTYLLAFVVGPYDVNEWEPIPPNDVRTLPLPLRGIAARGKGRRMDYALKNTGAMVHLFETYFDTPYPYQKLDIVAAPDFFGGAMENVGAIIYHEYLMLMDERSSLSQRRAYETTHAHELAHQWFGNYVTPAWWDDLWLNESFATWMQYKIAHDHWPEGEFSRSILMSGLGAMGQDSLLHARQIRNPVETNATIGDAFDGITYSKGGAVLAMFETYLGEEAFRAGVRTHMKRFAHGTATVDDFMKSLADGSGRPQVIPAFRSFIDQPGVPLVNASLRCDGRPRVQLRQSRYAPIGSAIDTAQTWQIPLCASFGSDYGQDMTCGLIDAIEIDLALDTEQCPAYVLPNGDGSGYFRFALDAAGWDALTQVAESLTPKQALAYGDSLNAAFRADAASADDFLDGIVALSRHDTGDVIVMAAGQFESLFHLPPDSAARGDMEAFGRKIFGPIHTAIGDANDISSRMLRSRLTRFLALAAKDTSLRTGMLDKARAYVGLNAERDPNAIEPDLTETFLSVGVQDDGAPFFDALLELVNSSSDPAMRSNGIGALAQTKDTDLAVRLLDTVLTDAFSLNELGYALSRLLWREETKTIAWDWAKQNLDRLMARGSGMFATRGIVSLGGSFCSPEEAADYKSVVLTHAEQLPGYERPLAQTLESIELCTALKATKGAQLANAVKSKLE